MATLIAKIIISYTLQSGIIKSNVLGILTDLLGLILYCKSGSTLGILKLPTLWWLPFEHGEG